MAPVTTGRHIAGRLDNLDGDLSISEVLRAGTGILGQTLDFDAAAVTAADPTTLLPTAAAHIVGLPAWSCGPYWDAEYLRPDVMTFEELHHRGDGATTLHRMTGGRPERSRRYREIYSRLALNSELRAPISLGGHCYGMLDLVRGEGAPDFSDAELAMVDEAVPALARRIRHAIASPPLTDDPLPEGTSVIILDESGDILSMTPEARDNLALLPETLNDGRSSAIFLNAIVHAVWARARFLASGLDAPQARARIVLRDGRRMTLRGSCTRTEEGHMGHTVLTLEPTRRSQLGLLLLATYELTDREEEIVSLLLRGDSAQQIATRLGISLHTVRTHTKHIHEKTGVSSRAELTMLFIDEEFLPNATITTHA